jgi:hypothetical protein
MLIENVLHCTHVKTAAGREIRAVFCDGVLDLTLSSPREHGRPIVRGEPPRLSRLLKRALNFEKSWR